MTARIIVVVAVFAPVVVLARLYVARRGDTVRALDLPPLPEDLVGPNATWVIFTTKYCATCQPVKERIARLDPTADLIEIDVADRPDLATRYRVRTAPTILFAAGNGRVHARFVGNVPEQELALVRE